MVEDKTKSGRSMNFELLRILSILSIIAGHLSTMRSSIPNPLDYFGDINCFVMVTGYFMVTGRFKSQRFLRLAIETVFYCFIITLCFRLYDSGVLNVDLVKSLIPFGPHSYSYWFVNKFLALLMLQPFLSYIAVYLTKRQYQWMLIILLLLNSQLIVGFPFSVLFDNGWSLPWFVTLFFLGGYIRLFNPFSKVRAWGWYWLGSVILLYFVSAARLSIVGKISYNSWFFLTKSVFMFMCLKSIEISSLSVVGKITAFFSPNVLAVYLIHNQHLMAIYLSVQGAAIVSDLSEVEKLLSWSGATILVWIICTLIDKFRVEVFRIIGISDFVNQLSGRIDQRLASYFPEPK